ncbi:conserved Plasmodium protein, unknown function [Plasmodium gallinaceum]|uniref:Uncharacterized protein n=1 Tax=Plasmodium gallinaceum TaxID=5849 RepID=A0A1J1GL96_PLAGA|nr:conserved Plasmodium protein, unknown function [Plasmodium gallinaceum]CRG93108.1 conserved Plasmodium protein, unknown function [Plasmodium gallinaceum]
MVNMKSIHQVNNIGDSFMYPKNSVDRTDTINRRKDEYKMSMNFHKKTEESNKRTKNNYEYLDSTHLEMLDLNKDIQNILPKPIKPSINLESLCKETSATLKNNSTLKSIKKVEEQQKNIKHFYELGSPQIIGTYIQPLNKNQNNSVKDDNLENNSFPLAPSSPFFQPPKFSTKLTQPTNQFLSTNINKSTNIYGLPSYLIPENKPHRLNVTVVPNKDKDILEKEAKHLKLLLDNSSQGIVNSTPDYQKIIDSNLSNNNDKESDFSFGKHENLENMQDEYSYENITDNNYNDSLINEFYDTNNCTCYSQMNELINHSNYNNENDFHLLSNEQLKKVNKELNQPKDNVNNLNKSNEKEKDIKNNSLSKKTESIKKKESISLSKKHEPSICFKNPKTYINIRLGRPKKLYITNSSDPIDKKLRDWHNTHNSQIGWKKNRRGVYTFGKTEVVLNLAHDKIIVKKINGKDIKDNLLTVEKFVSLNELYELQQEENDNELKIKNKKNSQFF